AWARVLDQAGHHGIRARSRCGAGEAPQCLYVFGTAGVHALGTVLTQYCDSAHAVAEAMPGYRLGPRPHAETLIMAPCPADGCGTPHRACLLHSSPKPASTSASSTSRASVASGPLASTCRRAPPVRPRPI